MQNCDDCEVQMDVIVHDWDSFWDTNPYFTEHYVEQPLTDATIQVAEEKLGYKLPQAYINCLKQQNGGKPLRDFWVKRSPAPHEVNIIQLSGFFGIGSEKRNSLFGRFGNEFWYREWGYPTDIGVIIADTDSEGHDLIYLDYRECSPEEEPKVSVCFQEYDYKIQVLADSFEEFVSQLVVEKDLGF